MRTDTLAPCPTEDTGTNCYWDATTMGNGMGASFVVRDGMVTYACGDAPADATSCVPWDVVVTPAPPAPPVTDIVTCEAGETAVTDYAPDTGWWGYCEPGAEPVASTAPAPALPDTLATTGVADVSPVTLIVGVLALAAGIAVKVLR